MTYGELRTHFLGLLNRDDCDNTLADLFIGQGVRRATRKLRIPLMKQTATITIDGSWTGTWSFPTGYLGLVEVLVDDFPVTRHFPGQQLIYPGFKVTTAGLVFDPELTEGQELEITYYSGFTIPATGVVPAFREIDDVMIYASLVYAASYFVDERKDAFNNDFEVLAGEVQIDADIDALSGGVIMSPYGGGIA